MCAHPVERAARSCLLIAGRTMRIPRLMFFSAISNLHLRKGSTRMFCCFIARVTINRDTYHGPRLGIVF
jgi:hypothetical protein